MSHYLHLKPYLITERNEEIKREVHALRLEARLREHRGSRGLRFLVFAKRGMLPLLRVAHLKG